jgi:organic radical activating enzyme
MSKVLIEAKPDFKKEFPDTKYLEVAEFFCDTVQGEGVNIGTPSAFLRMQHCTQNCKWCDSQEVWRYGNPYTFRELFKIMEWNNVVDKLKDGQHLVLTGGSPLKQQHVLVEFIHEFWFEYGFKPIIEIENECTLIPSKDMIELVDVWNNSPKLSNSGNSRSLSYQPDILKLLSSLNNSWFKFVITREQDWNEICDYFIKPGLIDKNQVILMALGNNRNQLLKNSEVVIEMALKNNVRYCTREHILLWDKANGV